MRKCYTEKNQTKYESHNNPKTFLGFFFRKNCFNLNKSSIEGEHMDETYIITNVTVDKVQEPVKLKNSDEEPIFIEDTGKTEETIFETENGIIHVIHEITLGDIVISTLLALILIFHLLDRFIRR